MKNCRLFLTAVLMAACLLACPAAHAIDDTFKLENDKDVASLKVGDIEVVAINDADTDIDPKLFSGPLSAEKRASYFSSDEVSGTTNVYLLKTGGKTILIDAGWGRDGAVQGQLFEKLAARGIAPGDIDLVMVTHMHLDHISGLLDKGKPSIPGADVLVSVPERDFWLDPALLNGEYKDGAELAGQVAKAYGDRLKTFSFGDEILPGITALDGAGHTPGHTMYMISSGNDRLLVVGDLVHVAALQFPNPDEVVVYDVDQAKALATRKAVFKKAAEENIPIAGMHIPFSGIGRVKDNGQGGFELTLFR